MPEIKKSAGVDKAMSMGRRLSALGSGNPATIATEFAAPDSAFKQAAGLGFQVLTSGPGAVTKPAIGDDGGAGPMPGARGSDPLMRRYRRVAGPGVM